MGIEEIFNGSMQDEVNEKRDAALETLEAQPPVETVETPEPVAEEPQPEPEQPQVEPQPQEEQSRHVPLATFLDQRDELKRWKQEAEQLRAAQQRQQPQPQAPDPLDDPDGFRQSILQEVDQHKVQVRFEVSDRIARQQHGDDTVEAAGAWAAEKARSDPSFAVAYMQQNHPIDWIVQQHKRDAMMTDIGSDPDEYVRRRAAELGFIQAPAPNAAPVAVTQQPVAQPAPPRSLAAAPGAGGAAAVPTGPTAALDSVFSR